MIVIWSRRVNISMYRARELKLISAVPEEKKYLSQVEVLEPEL